VPTYKRKELLSNLLLKISQQRTGDMFSYSVAVVDNDPSQSAADTVATCAASAGIPIEYFSEKVQNISLARNMAVRGADGNLIAFIDDDEYPEDTWLLNLFKTYTACNCSGVLGPTYPEFKGSPPKWIDKCSFFYRYNCRHKTGGLLKWNEGNTRNLLIEKRIFEPGGIYFDPLFGLSGGEDSDFFRRAFAAGHSFVWCNEAVVHELIFPERWTLRWLLRRALRSGGAYAMLLVKNNTPACRIIPMLKAMVYLCAHILFLPLAPLFGTHMLVECLMGISCELGKFLGLFGFVVAEYKISEESR
jgi:glycosyltransferase involved in cell wall biosynthesis